MVTIKTQTEKQVLNLNNFAGLQIQESLRKGKLIIKQFQGEKDNESQASSKQTNQQKLNTQTFFFLVNYEYASFKFITHQSNISPLL